MTLKDITLKGTLNLLIPKTLADVAHYLLGLAIYFGSLHLVHSGIALAITTAALIFKELNDKFGWIKWLLTDGENTTDANGKDFLMGEILPLLITIAIYLIP